MNVQAADPELGIFQGGGVSGSGPQGRLHMLGAMDLSAEWRVTAVPTLSTGESRPLSRAATCVPTIVSTGVHDESMSPMAWQDERRLPGSTTQQGTP